MLDLATQIIGLPLPSASQGAARFSGAPIASYETHRIAIDGMGCPVLLIAARDSNAPSSKPPIVLAHLAIQEGATCRIGHPDGSMEEGRFTVARCTSADPQIHEDFLRIGGMVIAWLGLQPTEVEVRSAMARLIELFRGILLPPTKTVVGLWGELFLIARSSHPDVLVRAWHVRPEDRYDFNAGVDRLEVKIAFGRSRVHHFSLEQVVPVPGMEVAVASMLTERAAGGPSLADLVARIQALVSPDPELQLRVEEVPAELLGNHWREARGTRFDEQLARASLMFYDAAVIPKPNPDVPAEVSEVRFRADLSRVIALDVTAEATSGGIVDAARPSAG